MNLFNDVITYNLKEFIDRIEYSKVNQLKISKANSLDHEIKKAEIFTKLIHSGLNVLVEPKCLDSRNRPDILVLDVMPMIAYEIVRSESEASLLRKERDYPFTIKVIRI
jgi:hypothetical protein